MKTIVITKGSLDTLDVFAEGLIHGFELLQYSILVLDKNNIWCIYILVGHPFCFHKELSLMPVKSAVLCVDINHMKYVERFYPNIAACGMMSHGGCFRG